MWYFCFVERTSRSMKKKSKSIVLSLSCSCWLLSSSLSLSLNQNHTPIRTWSRLNRSTIGTDFMKSCIASCLIGAAVCSPIYADTQPAYARVLDESTPQIYNNDYADPFHPLCARKIEVSSDGKSFHYSGTAVGPKGDSVLRGCSREEIEKYKLRIGAFDGAIVEDGNRLDAGDGVHVGVWEPAGSTAHDKDMKENVGVLYDDVDGIRWNDGNKWIVLNQSEVKRDLSSGKLIVLSKRE